jgi:RNA polymerase sigma-70 factor (ECF subfamily)
MLESHPQPSPEIPGPGKFLPAALAGDPAAFEALTEPYRRELLAHCYRILGSLEDAEDLLQETLLRAWKRLDTYEGRASLRAWLYKIATNACLDALDRRPRRGLPPGWYPQTQSTAPFPAPVTEPVWLEPFPDELLGPAEATPEARIESRESISLSFLVALQALSPRQRCVLILRDVLDWRAEELADMLGASLSSVNSLLPCPPDSKESPSRPSRTR